MKVRDPSILSLVMLFMVVAIFLVPRELVIIPIVANLGLMVLLRYLRRKPKKPTTWTVDGDLTDRGGKPIHPH